LVGVLVGVTNKIDNVNVTTLPNLNGVTPSRFVLNSRYIFLLGLLVFIECLFLFNVQSFIENIYIRIVMVFSGVSLSLFGGGFVAVPMMQSLFVNDLKWLTSEEFVDAIAFSQLTPGPILVSATFIGYKMGGVAGAILATVSMFTPSAVLIILVSKIHHLHQDNIYVRHALEGIKVVIIGMIAASAFKIIANDVYNMKAMSLCLVMFIAIHFFKVSPFLIILFSALLGFLVEKVI
jgi:chromate transporter